MDRSGLRQIVNLSARAAEEHIRREVIEIQEDTVVAALGILENEPGVLLADEVGMGKTFQSLAIIACLRHENPKARILIVTPTRELSEQWYWTAQRFGAHGFADLSEDVLGTVGDLKELPLVCRKRSVVFVPVNAFGGMRAKSERGFLLALWARHRRIPRAKLQRIRRNLAAAGLDLGDARDFFGHSLAQMLRKRLGAAFKRGRGETRGFRGLDDLLAEGLESFQNRTLARRALDRARFHAVGALLKPFDLLVVDEAHKFKDPWTVRSQAVTHVLHRNYHKAVFLTATPFQLGVEELKHVFRLFDGALSSPERFNQDVDRLLRSVREYQVAYERFESAWQLVDPVQAEAFRAWSDRLSPSADRPPARAGTDDPNVAYLAERAWELLRLKKEHVEPAFRQWTLRSLKPSRRVRRAIREWYLRGSGGAVIPLTLFQRLRWEAMRRGVLPASLTTDLSISSSYEAAENSRLLKEKSQHSTVAAYQRLVTRAIRATTDRHPKIAAVVDEILDATEAGDKTLVFCERNASIRELQRLIEDGWMQRQLGEWNEVCPGYTFEQVFGGGAGDKRVRGFRQKIPPRFYRGSDELSLALTESLPFALFSTEGTRSELPRSFWQASTQFIEEANRLLSQCRVPLSSALRPDFPLASRCIDQVVVRWYLNRDKDLSRLGPGDRELIDLILKKDYPAVGFAKLLPEQSRAAAERSKVQWTITRGMFDTILSPRRPGIWIYYRRHLGRLTPVVRRMAVEAVRYFLTRREVPFLVTAMQRAGGPKASSAELRNAIDVWWQQETCIWRQSVAELIEYLPCLTETEQQAILKDMLRSPRVVQNSLAATSRILRQNTFNAPFYPMVLLGNQTIQQGLDLHRQCRRVIHYDLRWSPTDLEQRVGRVERHGCLAERFDVDRPEGKVQVIYPLLEHSADPNLYRDVQLRERWMDFLLGHSPTASEHDPEGEPVEPLPSSLVDALRIRLNPPQLKT
jgi:superfamily II DNA or RNA helicase